MTRFVSMLVVAGALVLADARALAAPADLDPTFSGDGKATTSFEKGNNEGKAVAIQPGGRIVVAGSIVGPVPTAFVGRYKSDGTLDPTFGGDGKVRMQDGKGGVCQAYAVALQPDGKIVVAGENYGEVRGHRWWRWALFRYRANGSLDPSFGGDGRVFTDVTRGRDYAQALVVRPNGRIVVAGTGHRRRFALVRYNPNGTRDRTFSGDGRAFANVLSGHGREGASDLAVQADGKFVAAGYSSALPSTVGQRAALVRFTRSGSLDQTYGGDGWETWDVPSYASGLVVQSDGYIVAAGYADGGPALARYAPDGILDSSFDGDGTVAMPGVSGALFDVVLQSDGKIIATGREELPDEHRVALLARYDTEGSPDPTFGGDGTAVTEDFEPSALALQADGRIVAVGYAGGPLFSRMALARYLGG